MHNCFKLNHPESRIKSFRLHVNTCASSLLVDGRYFGEHNGVRSTFGINSPWSGSSTAGGTSSYFKCIWKVVGMNKKYLELYQLIEIEIYRFYATYNSRIAQFNDCRTVSRTDWFDIYSNWTKCVKLTPIRPYIMRRVISIVLDWMDCSKY